MTLAVLKNIQIDFRRSDGWLSSAIRFFVVLGSVLPLVAVLVDIAQNSINLPFLDQWNASYRIAIKTLDRSLTFGDLLQPHLEHRIFFTNIVTALSTAFLHWNLQLELLVTVFFAALVLLFIVLLIQRDYSGLAWIVAIPVSVLIFSLRGEHTWLTSFQSCFVFALFFLVAALWVLGVAPSNRRLVVAALLAVGANYSIGAGLLAWPVIFIVLPLLGYRRWYQLLFWIIVGAASVFFYIRGITSTLAEPLTLAGLPDLARYALVYLGAPFVPGTTSFAQYSLIITIVGIVLFGVSFVWLLWRQYPLKKLAVWMALAGFAVGAALMTAFGRVSLFRQNPAQPLSERYIIFAVVWWVAVIVVSVVAIKEAFSQGLVPGRWFARVSIIILVILIPLDIYAEYNTVVGPQKVPRSAGDCIMQIMVFPMDDRSCLKPNHINNPDRWLPEAQTLAELRLALFHQQPINVPIINAPFVIQQPIPDGDWIRYSTLQTPTTASLALLERPPSTIEYQVYIPAIYNKVSFRALVYVDPHNGTSNSATPEDSVEFIALVASAAENSMTSDPISFDPTLDSVPIPILLDLSAFSGQTVSLRLETDPRQSENNEWAYWINPVISLSSD